MTWYLYESVLLRQKCVWNNNYFLLVCFSDNDLFNVTFMEASITFMDTVYCSRKKMSYRWSRLLNRKSYGTFRFRLSPVLIPFFLLKLELNNDTNRNIPPINLSWNYYIEQSSSNMLYLIILKRILFRRYFDQLLPFMGPGRRSPGEPFLWPIL